METVNQLILSKSVNIFRHKSSSEQTKRSTDSEIFKRSLRCCFDCTCGAAFLVSESDVSMVAPAL